VARAWVEVNQRFAGEVSKRFRIMSGSARAGGANPRPLTLLSFVHGTRRHVEALREEIRRTVHRPHHRSPRCWHRWAYYCRLRKPRSCTWTMGSISSVSVPSRNVNGNGEALHLSLHRPTPDPVVEGTRPRHTGQRKKTSGPCWQAQPGRARLCQLLQTCPVAKNVFSMMNNFTRWGIIRMLQHHWRWNDVRRRFIDPTGRGIQSRQMSRVAPDLRRSALAVPLPGLQDLHTLGAISRLTTATALSPLRWKLHGGFDASAA
jgi:hypothetical protein